MKAVDYAAQMRPYGLMHDSVAQIEADCTALGLSPVKVLKQAGLHGGSLWCRWKSGVYPNLRSIERVRAKLEELRALASRQAA